MANPLFNQLNNTPLNLMQQFNDFKNTFKGNPRDEVQRLLNSGQMSQAQYNELQSMAQQFMRFIK